MLAAVVAAGTQAVGARLFPDRLVRFATIFGNLKNLNDWNVRVSCRRGGELQQ